MSNHVMAIGVTVGRATCRGQSLHCASLIDDLFSEPPLSIASSSSIASFLLHMHRRWLIGPLHSRWNKINLTKPLRWPDYPTGRRGTGNSRMRGQFGVLRPARVDGGARAPKNASGRVMSPLLASTLCGRPHVEWRPRAYSYATLA